MTQHVLLRTRLEQHKIKNILSKIDDESIKECSITLIQLLREDYPSHFFELKSSLTFKEIANYCNFTLNDIFSDRKILPDGGVIWMDDKYPILISEIKHQGTNKERLQEGKSRQAMGNAIERYGKNLMALQTMFNQDEVLPAVVFCWGCDFLETTVLSKLYAMNCFQPLNRYYFKTIKGVKPHNIFYKEDKWSNEEMLSIMYELSVSYIAYFLKE